MGKMQEVMNTCTGLYDATAGKYMKPQLCFNVGIGCVLMERKK